MTLTLEQALERGHAIAVALERPPALGAAIIALAELQQALSTAAEANGHL